MTGEKLYNSILESLAEPIVFVDNSHIIRFMNKAAVKRFEKRGGASLVGRSIFDCHNAESVTLILEIFEALKNGEDERVYPGSLKASMRAVRDSDGVLIGYYERYLKD